MLSRSGSPTILPLESKIALVLFSKDVDADVGLVVADVDEAAAALPAAAVTATAVAPASGYEIEFFIRQFDGVSEFGDLLHVGLLLVFDLSGEIVALTAATLSLAARRQSGCTVGQRIFFAATPKVVFSFSCHASPGDVIADLSAANILVDQNAIDRRLLVRHRHEAHRR